MVGFNSVENNFNTIQYTNTLRNQSVSSLVYHTDNIEYKLISMVTIPMVLMFGEPYPYLEVGYLLFIQDIQSRNKNIQLKVLEDEKEGGGQSGGIESLLKTRLGYRNWNQFINLK